MNRLNYEKTGEKLKNCRKSLGYSQLGLSKLLYVSKQSISKWERGMMMPPLQVLVEMTGIFGVNLEDVIVIEKV